MDSNLNALEQKVLEAVELIKGLRSENKRLDEQCRDLTARLEELEAANRKLEQDLADARRQAADGEMYEAKRKEVEDKVGGLLAQLEALG
jgi:septal ring factor EnvC (AmiA/AmiB activator)